jgi:hypothetical protein
VRTVPVTLKFDRYPDVIEGTAVVVDRSPGARIGRALLGLAIVWFFMFLGVFVPGFHFVIVPTLFVVGIVVFVLKLKEHHSLVEVRGRCPRCKDAVERSYPESGTFKDGRKIRCPQCAEPMTLVVRKELPAS